jgi:DNA-binding response OmpR family regulator
MAHVSKALVVEKDHFLRYSITRALEKHGVDVDVAEAESDAIELGSLRRYCAVLVDLLLPAIDNGRRVLTAISRAHPTVPLFVLSDVDMEVEGLPTQVRAIFKKPLDGDELAEMIRKECLQHPAGVAV